MVVRHGGRGPGHLSRWTARPGGGGWTPDDLGGALVGWIDAEDASTLSLTGNLVNSITDKRSGGVFSQTISASKPVLNATAINGRPSIIADEVDDYLESAVTPGAYPTGPAPLEIWSLAAPTTLAADNSERWIISYGGGANTTRRHGRGVSGGQIQARTRAGTGSGTQFAGSSNPQYLGVHAVRSIYGADGTLSVEIDGQGAVTQASTIATTTGRARLFANDATSPGNFFGGAFNSLYLINPAHANWTPENVANMWAFLKSRGGIA